MHTRSLPPAVGRKLAAEAGNGQVAVESGQVVVGSGQVVAVDREVAEDGLVEVENGEVEVAVAASVLLAEEVNIPVVEEILMELAAEENGQEEL